MWNLVEKLRRYRTAPRTPGAQWKIVGSDERAWSIFSRRAGGRPAPISVSLLRAGTLGTPPQPQTRAETGNHDRAEAARGNNRDKAPAPDTASRPATSSHCSSDVEEILEQDGAGDAVAEVLFVEPVDESMNHLTPDVRSSSPGHANGGAGSDSGSSSGSGSNGNTMSASDAQQIRESLAGKVICPFCGQTKSASAEPCPRCTMEDTPATRQATKTRIGPWYVLQNRSPSAPGMKFSTLLWLINKGHVTARSIIRGPTTHQLWRYAAHVRGLSREFGLCYSCGEAIARSSANCPHCDRPQEPPVDPDVLVETRETFAPTPAVAAAPSPAPAAPVRPTITRKPIMREVPLEVVAPAIAAAPSPAPAPAPAAPPRRGANGHGTPEPATFAMHDRIEDEHEEHLDPPAYEPSHSERLRLRGEMSVRQRQEQFRRATTGTRDVSGMALVTALQEPDVAEARPRRVSLINVALFVLLLGAGAAAAVLYLRPEYRAPTAAWFNNAWTTVRDRVASFKPTSPGEPSPAAATVARDSRTDPPPIVPPHLPRQEPQAPVVPDPKTLASNQPSDAKQQPQTSAPAPDPKDDASAQLARNQQQQQQQQEQLRQAEQKDAPKREPEPQPNVRPPQEQPPADRVARRDESRQPKQQQEPAQPESEPRRDLDRDMDEVRKLWDKALAAEWEDDYASAVRYYEQIKKFPAAAWESKRGQLEINLRIVKSRLESSAKSQ